MAVYTKSFNIAANDFILKKIVSYNASQIVFGESKNGIVIFIYDENQTLINTKEIVYDNNKVTFCDVHINKHIVLIVKSKSESARSHTLHFLRIRPDGSIIDQNQLNLKQGIHEVLSVLPLNGAYFLLIETPQGGSFITRAANPKDFYYLVITKELQVLRLNKMENVIGLQYNGAVINGTNIVLFGKRSRAIGNSGLLTVLNSTFDVVTSFMAQETSGVQEFNSAINHDGNGLVVFGIAKTSIARRERTTVIASRVTISGNRIKIGLSWLFNTSDPVTCSIQNGETFLCLTYGAEYKSKFLVFDANLLNINHQEFTPVTTRLVHLSIAGTVIQLVGTYKEIPTLAATRPTGLLMTMNEKFEVCAPINLPRLREFEHTWSFDLLASKSDPVTIATLNSPFLRNNAFSITAKYICQKSGDITVDPNTATAFKITPDALIQSTHLNLSAAGSGIEALDSTKGIHLRWFLTEGLNDHLPKGNYATTTSFLNKPNDFVRVYRAPYIEDKNWGIQLNLLNDSPFDVIGSTWVYKKLVNGRETHVSLKFDESRYTASVGNITFYQIKTDVNQRKIILEHYGKKEVTLSVEQELLFSVRFNSASAVRVETFSKGPRDNFRGTRQSKISAREEVIAGQVVYSENIAFIKFAALNLTTIAVGVESYSDIIARSANQITAIGTLALETDSTKALARLESPELKVGGVWNKFDSGQKVNTENYRKRWADPAFGIKMNVEKYIQLSNTSPRAVESFTESSTPIPASTDPTIPKSTMSVSFLDLLKVSSLDFHNARMLGLGSIDKNVIPTQKYIYFIEYITEKNLSDLMSPKRIQHLYFSLPTGLDDKRLPQNIALQDITFGLKIENGENEPLYITDENGYAYKQGTRYVNLKTAFREDYSSSISFFKPLRKFQSSTFSTPVFIGFKRKLEVGTSSLDWPKPDLIHEQESYFSDSNNTIRENSVTLFDPKDPNKPDYIDTIVDENGGSKYEHHYAAYAINVFSRTNELSNVQTVISEFIKDNSLKPPSNINAHLIQEESETAPMFSTVNEQSWLKNITGDKTLVRLLFDYNHVQGKNYDFAKKVRIFHRVAPIRNVIGSLIIPPNVPSDRECIVETRPFRYGSGEVYTPKITVQEMHKFIGSFLIYNSKSYEVLEVFKVPNGENPSLRLLKNEIKSASPNTENGDFDGTYQLNQAFEGPTLDYSNPNAAAFLLVENMSKADNWINPTSDGTQLSFEVDLENELFRSTTEAYLDDEGNPHAISVRGIWDNCKVEYEILNSKAQYVISFDTVVLPNHPQFNHPDNTENKASVNWFKGYVRIHTRADMNLPVDQRKARKALQVEQIINLGGPNKLQLLVSDPDYVPNGEPQLATGVNISVNFFPSYKVYFRSEAIKPFNESTTLPLANANERTTLIGLQAVDSSNGYTSVIGVPSPLVSHKVITLNKPEQPIGPLFATPPNYYGKAKYTFSTKFIKTPWAVVFFRADINRILSVLYTEEILRTVVRPALLPFGKDDFFLNRWQNLLSVACDVNGNFTSYPDQSGNDFAFPAPNNAKFGFNANLVIGSSEWKDHIKLMIQNCMLPLTENPLICEFIKGVTSGQPNYIPTSKKQVLRTPDGMVLHPTDPEFDMAPMAKMLGDKEIQFTDFTLEGNMNINTAYVYIAREMNMSLKFGEASDFLGPVQLINTTAPEPLVLNKLNVKSPSFQNGFQPRVIFEVNKVRESQNVSSVLIYRYDNSLDSLHSRGIKPVKEIELASIDNSASTFLVEDDFSDGSVIPYGKPIYYNLVGVRKITYRDGVDLKEEWVYSKPSKTIITNIVDLSRPAKPEPLVTFDVQNNLIKNLLISLNRCCQNGTYSVYHLNAANNWELIETLTTNDESFSISIANDLGLVSKNEDDESVYHKFKIVAENPSGLRIESNVFSLVERV